MVKEFSINVAKDYTGYTGNYNHVFAELGRPDAVVNKHAQELPFFWLFTAFYPLASSPARIFREPSQRLSPDPLLLQAFMAAPTTGTCPALSSRSLQL